MRHSPLATPVLPHATRNTMLATHVSLHSSRHTLFATHLSPRDPRHTPNFPLRVQTAKLAGCHLNRPLPAAVLQASLYLSSFSALSSNKSSFVFLLRASLKPSSKPPIVSYSLFRSHVGLWKKMFAHFLFTGKIFWLQL